MTTSSTMKCCDGNCVRRWPLTSFGSYRPGPYPHKGKGVCVRDVCAIYDNNISPSLLMIIIKIIILYFIQIRHTDAFPPTGTLLVRPNSFIGYQSQRGRGLYRDTPLLYMLSFIRTMSDNVAKQMKGFERKLMSRRQHVSLARADTVRNKSGISLSSPGLTTSD